MKIIRFIWLIILILGIDTLYAQSGNLKNKSSPQLTGTTVLTLSNNNWLAINYGYDLKKICATECDSKSFIKVA